MIASSASLIVDIEIYDNEHSWFEISDHGYIRNHDSEGDTLYGIEIMVDPEYHGNSLSRKLYDARKALARKYNLRRLVLGGRIPGHVNYKDKLTVTEYIEQVADKVNRDPDLLRYRVSGNDQNRSGKGR